MGEITHRETRCVIYWGRAPLPQLNSVIQYYETMALSRAEPIIVLRGDNPGDVFVGVSSQQKIATAADAPVVRDPEMRPRLYNDGADDEDAVVEEHDDEEEEDEEPVAVAAPMVPPRHVVDPGADYMTKRVYFWTIIEQFGWKNVGIMEQPPVGRVAELLKTADIVVIKEVYTQLLRDVATRWPGLTSDALAHYIASGPDMYSEILAGSDWATTLFEVGECVVGPNSFDNILKRVH